jgi:hypothetical protein
MRSILVALALIPGLISAQTVVPAYEGGAFAWDYPADAANHAGFRLNIDGITGSTQIAKDLRQIKLTDTLLSGKPFGPYTVRLVATATAPATNSTAAVLKIDYQARPSLITPTNTRVILEWVP